MSIYLPPSYDRATANLQQPHFLALIDSGSSDGLLWYAMPFVDAATATRS